MARLVWGVPDDRPYESGVHQVTLYHPNFPGVPWVGVTSIDDTGSKAEHETVVIDGERKVSCTIGRPEEFRVSCYSYPIELSDALGDKELSQGVFLSSQKQTYVSMSYKTTFGESSDKLHLIYNLYPHRETFLNNTTSRTVSPTTFPIYFVSLPPTAAALYRPSSHIWFDLDKVNPEGLDELEEILYGTDETDPEMPPQSVVFDLLSA